MVSKKRYTQIQIFKVILSIGRTKYKIVRDKVATGKTKVRILDKYVFAKSLSLLCSIKNLNAAVCICSVVTGNNKLTNIVIRSYVPYCSLDKHAVRIGRVTKETNFGKNVPIDKMNVFFSSFDSLLIL